MLRMVWTACLLVLYSGAVLAQDDQVKIFALSRADENESERTVLQSLDPESGETATIGETGLSQCRGLEADAQGTLFSICLVEDFYHLAEIDRERGQAEGILPSSRSSRKGDWLSTSLETSF